MRCFEFHEVNIGRLNRFVQCNVHMEDMQFAQRIGMRRRIAFLSAPGCKEGNPPVRRQAG